MEPLPALRNNCLTCQNLRNSRETRKPCYRKDDRAMRPIYGCPEKFRESSQTPPATFPEICKGLLFWSILRMCTQNLKFVALSAPEIIGGTQKIWAVPVYAHAPVSLKFLMGFCSYGPSVWRENNWEALMSRQLKGSSRSALQSLLGSRYSTRTVSHGDGVNNLQTTYTGWRQIHAHNTITEPWKSSLQRRTVYEKPSCQNTANNYY